MIKLAVTRFNNTTFNENKKWRESRQYDGSIYGSSVKIKESVSPEVILIVFEMNNTLDIIEGIGIIKNSIIHKKYNIYSDKNYNRYIYKSNFRVDKNLFDDNIQINIKKLEKLLFTGKTHLKRGHGIQIISDTLKKLDNFNFDNYFIETYKSYLCMR
jgi:hypothetical protein|tara:strand:- start:1738 stop:2208 length:471 start_codon:yes stop_codon:yes gene_type:complete